MGAWMAARGGGNVRGESGQKQGTSVPRSREKWAEPPPRLQSDPPRHVSSHVPLPSTSTAQQST